MDKVTQTEIAKEVLRDHTGDEQYNAHSHHFIQADPDYLFAVRSTVKATGPFGDEGTNRDWLIDIKNHVVVSAEYKTWPPEEKPAPKVKKTAAKKKVKKDS